MRAEEREDGRGPQGKKREGHGATGEGRRATGDGRGMRGKERDDREEGEGRGARSRERGSGSECCEITCIEGVKSCGRTYVEELPRRFGCH